MILKAARPQRDVLLSKKKTINKMKIFIDWEKILANDVIDKGLSSKIHKQLIHLNQKLKIQSKNGQKTYR